MAYCQRFEIWKTQSSSRSSTVFDDVKTDRKLIQIYATGDRDLCCHKPLPGRSDGSSLPSDLTDTEERQRRDVLKPPPPEINLLQVHVSEGLPTSSNGVGGSGDRKRIANVYVDGPASAATTRMEDGESTRRDGVKSRSSPQRLNVGTECTANAGSIVCERCGGCRCERCGADGRQLPGVWCGPRCGYCTPSRVVDVISCVCCVRAVVYHCSADDDVCKPDHPDDDFDDDVDDCPCSCSGSPSRCRRRWACLAALGGLGCLPCLLLYWPLRALLAAGRAVYSAVSRRRGCRCGHSGNKRTARGRLLLADAESSST